jgi:hypothetical protein
VDQVSLVFFEIASGRALLVPYSLIADFGIELSSTHFITVTNFQSFATRELFACIAPETGTGRAVSGSRSLMSGLEMLVLACYAS